jgi:hypothetical protein
MRFCKKEERVENKTSVATASSLKNDGMESPTRFPVYYTYTTYYHNQPTMPHASLSLYLYTERWCTRDRASREQAPAPTPTCEGEDIQLYPERERERGS